MLWFAKLAAHGPLPSSFLLRYCQSTHRSEKRSRERLTDLFNEDNTPDGDPYLSRPPQQFRTLDSRYNQLVYDLAPAAIDALKQAGFWLEYLSAPSGPWLHRFMTSCITGSIELAVLDRSDLRYIPGWRILERAETALRYPTKIVDPATGRTVSKDLLPDALFGLEYRTGETSRYRFFLVEADRATEPFTSRNFNRKSLLRNLLQYEEYIGRGAYRDHLKLTAPLLVLNVSSDPKRTARMIDLIANRYPDGNSFMLYRTWEDFGPVFRPPHPHTGCLNDDWERAGLPPFRIDQV